MAYLQSMPVINFIFFQILKKFLQFKIFDFIFLFNQLLLFGCDDGDDCDAGDCAADDCGDGGASIVFSAFFPNHFLSLFRIVFSFSVSDLSLAFFLHTRPFEYNQNDNLLP